MWTIAPTGQPPQSLMMGMLVCASYKTGPEEDKQRSVCEERHTIQSSARDSRRGVETCRAGLGLGLIRRNTNPGTR
jgi:hypothetical protein